MPENLKSLAAAIYETGGGPKLQTLSRPAMAYFCTVFVMTPLLYRDAKSQVSNFSHSEDRRRVPKFKIRPPYPSLGVGIRTHV